MKIKTTNQIKTELMLLLSYRLKHQYVITEGPNYSDVFSINPSGYSCEYEIKVSRSDLKKELDCMISEECDWHRADNKIQKHHYYQMGLPMVEETNPSYFGGFLAHRYFVPNKYYFVIPETLFNYLALELASKKLPYGVVVIPEKEGAGYWEYQTRIQPTFLHKVKADEKIKMEMFNRAVNELVDLRSRFCR